MSVILSNWNPFKVRENDKLLTTRMLKIFVAYWTALSFTVRNGIFHRSTTVHVEPERKDGRSRVQQYEEWWKQ
jgi:hypothetical protein